MKPDPLRTALMLLVAIPASLGVAACGEQGPTASVAASHPLVSVSTNYDVTPVPGALQPVNAEAAGLVDFWPSEYGGSWYDPVAGQIVLSYTSESSKDLVAQRMDDADQLTLVPADYSFEMLEKLSREMAESFPNKDVILQYGAEPHGLGVQFGIARDLSAAELSAVSAWAEGFGVPLELVILPGQGRPSLDRAPTASGR